jgi:hypothetical protein
MQNLWIFSKKNKILWGPSQAFSLVQKNKIKIRIEIK